MRFSHFVAAIALLLSPAVTPLAAQRAAPARPPLRTIEFALLEDYDKGDDLARVRGDFRVMKDLGIRTWRGSFGWDDYEPEPGKYDFAWLRRFVALAAEEGIRLRPYVGYTPAWAGGGGKDKEPWNDAPRSIAQWQVFVRRLAGEFAHQPAVASWEIYNEENAPQWFDGTVEQYAAVLKSASATIRAVAPRAQVVMGGLTYPDADWLRAVCTRGGDARAFDVAALHVYAETWPREKRVEDVLAGDDYRGEFLGALKSDCAGQPLWVNETGFATNPGRTEAEQAAWWARAIATYAADPSISFVGVYETRDLHKGSAVIGEPENYYLGIRRADGTHKLAYATVKLMVSLLGAPFRVLADPRLDGGGAQKDVAAHLFERADGRRVLLAWTRGATATTRRFALGRRTGRLTRYSLGGVPHALPPADTVELRLAPGEVAIVVAD